MSSVIADRVAQILDLGEDSEALWYAGDSYSWRVVGEARRRVEAVLEELGVPRGQPVAVVARNVPSMICATIGLLAEGRPVYPVNRMENDYVVARGLAEAAVGALILEPGRDADLAHLVSPELPRIEVVIDPPVDGQIDAASDGRVDVPIHGQGPQGGVEVHRAGGSAPPPSTAYSSGAPPITALLTTSGTTGTPKRVPISAEQIVKTFEAQAHYRADPLKEAPVLRSGVHVLCMPPFNITGMWQLLQSLATGLRIALLERFEPNEWARVVRDLRPTAGRLPPAALTMILDAGIPRDWLGSLRAIWTGGAPLDPHLAQRFEDAYGVPVLQSYGATEFTGAIAGWTLADKTRWGTLKRGSVGRAHPGIAIRAVDPDTDAPLPAGEVGALAVQSAQRANHDGQHGDQWVRTADLGRIDEDGFVWILGRTDDVINRGGYKVFPEAVESTLRLHPHVRDAIVAGIPDPRLGQVPVAAVEVSDPAVTQDELISWVKDRLPPYFAPVLVLKLDTLPRNTSMKGDRRAVATLARNTSGESSTTSMHQDAAAAQVTTSEQDAAD